MLGTAVGMAGTFPYSLPFLVQPLQAAFGWSRQEISGAATAQTIGTLIAAPILGRLCDRFGVARTALGSTFAAVVTLISMSVFINSLTTLYAGYLLAACLGTGTTYIAYLKIISSRFDKMRGMALGMTMASAGLMAVIVPQVLPQLIEAYGWRMAYVAIAVVMLIAVPLCLGPLQRKTPALGSAEPVGSRDPWGSSIRQAIRTRRFWFMWAGVLMLAMTTIGSSMFLVEIIEEAGVVPGSAAGMMSIYGLAIVLGRVTVGLALDRVHGPYVAAVNFLLPAIGMLLLARLGPSYAGPYLFLVGLAAGGEVDVLAYLCGRYFGMRFYGEVFGWLFTGVAVGFAIGPILVGGARDAIGTFTPMLYIGSINCVVASVMFLTLGRYPTIVETGWNSDSHRAQHASQVEVRQAPAHRDGHPACHPLPSSARPKA